MKLLLLIFFISSFSCFGQEFTSIETSKRINIVRKTSSVKKEIPTKRGIKRISKNVKPYQMQVTTNKKNSGTIKKIIKKTLPKKTVKYRKVVRKL